jgi:GAF domain-containing protein
MLILEGNTLRHGGAPSLPTEYCEAVDGLVNGPVVGSCGTSTCTGKTVLVENIETDPKWQNIKQYALPHGLRCCWSEPIKNASDEVLGAFGMYYTPPRFAERARVK